MLTAIALVELPLLGLIAFFGVMSVFGSGSAHFVLSIMITVVLALASMLVIGVERRFRRDTSRFV